MTANHMNQALKKRIIKVCLIFGFFFLLSIYYSTETLVVFLRKGIPTTFAEQLVSRLLQWGPWALLTWFVLGFAKKYPLDIRRWRSFFPIHLLSGLLFAVLHVALYMLLFFIFFQAEVNKIPDYFVTLLAKSTHFNLLVYFIIISLWNMWDYYRRNQENELKTSQLETQLAQTQLDVLRGQLNPHFLFNTLHMILAHVRKNPDIAESMIDRLSTLLRKTLEVSNSQEISFQEELEYLKIYLEIQECRFQERMESRLNIAADTLEIAVPNLFLQPLVENAIQHAIAPKAKGGTIQISSWRENNTLIVEVRDSGPGFPEDRENIFKAGFGLSNTRERLRLLYGKNSFLTLENPEGGGAQVKVGIPIQRKNSAS